MTRAALRHVTGFHRRFSRYARGVSSAAPVLDPARCPLPPSPRGRLLSGSFFALWERPLELLLEGQRQHGDVVRFRVFHRWLYQLTKPEYVGHVLRDNASNYPKSETYDDLAVVLGNGLLTSEGAFWKRQRRLAQPAFHRDQLARFVPLMHEAAQAMHAPWRDGQPVEVSEASMRLALSVVGRALFSTDLGSDAEALGPAVREALEFANDRTLSLLKAPLAVPLPRHLRFKRALRVLEQPIHAMIAARREAGEAAAQPDLLSRLVFARDPESGEGMTDRQLRDELITFLLAGHETTAHALTWTLHLLAQHPEADAAVAAELQARPAPEDFDQLALLRRVVLESLRLYPPAWVIERSAAEDDVVGGYRIPAGSLVMLPAYVVHRHSDVWREPERFDPDRFSPERVRDRPRDAYFPFGGGQRKCVGEDFAMQELLIALGELLRAWRFEPAPGFSVELAAGVTLRPAHGLQLVPRRRAPA
jgi:cytochrome P450